jgi:hypothetical protein
MSAEQKQEEKKMTESIGDGNFKHDPNISLGENVEKLAKATGGYGLMDADNKKMLEKVKEAKTDKEVTQALMSDPDSGRSMSYAESRMRFG